MSRTERMRHMHERRLLWRPIPRCTTCDRILSVLTDDGVASACERCSTVSGDLTADTPATVGAVFRTAVDDVGRVVEQVRAESSIWDSRLRDRELSARIVSAAARGQRGWAVLRLTPGFGGQVQLFAKASSAVGESVRVVLAGVADTARVSDVRTGRTLVVDGG
jgi:hypothetical protein